MTDLNQQSLEEAILEIKKIIGDRPIKARPTQVVLRPVDIQAIADRRGISFDEALADIKDMVRKMGND